MPNIKYNEQPLHQFCNDEGCWSSESTCASNKCCPKDSGKPKCQFSSSVDKKCPPGYKDKGWATGSDLDGYGCDCAGAWGYRVCDKLPSTNAYWNPLENQYAGDQNNKVLIDKVYKCCHDAGYLSHADIENCGNLYKGGTTGTCGGILEEYCLSDENIIKPQCKSAIPESQVLQEHLKEICPGKDSDTTFDEVCPCYYGYPYYKGLVQNLKDVGWEGPLDLIDTSPHCINPRCKSWMSTNFPDKAQTPCKGQTFAKCVIQNDLNLTKASIKNLKLNSSCNFKLVDPSGDKNKKNTDDKNKKNNGNEDAPKGTCEVENDCKSSETCKDKKCVPKSNNTKIIIIISVTVALFLLLGGLLMFL